MFVHLQIVDFDVSFYISLLLMKGANEDIFAIASMSDPAAMNIYMCQFIDYFHKLATCICILSLLNIVLTVISEVAKKYCFYS